MAGLEGTGIKPLQLLAQPLGQDRVFQRLARLFWTPSSKQDQLERVAQEKERPESWCSQSLRNRGRLRTIGVEYFRGYRKVPPVVDKSDHRVVLPWFPEN